MSEYNAYKYNQKASLLRGARWARDEEIKAATRRIRLSDPDSPVCSGFPVISNGDTVYLDDSDAHSLIIGSTGSKKSRLFAMPMLEIMRRAGDSVVVTDPKGELYDRTSQSFKKSGYQVFVVNLRDPVHSNGWNPLALARYYQNRNDREKAATIVNDLAMSLVQDDPRSRSDPFWHQTSRAMLQGLIMMMVENRRIFPDRTVNLLTLRQLSDNLDRDGYSFQEKGVFGLLESYPDDSLAKSHMHMLLQGSDRTYDNIRVSYEAAVHQLYMQNSLVSMLSYDEIDLSRIGTQKTILYLIMPDEKTTLHAIVSLIIKVCYEQLIAVAQKCPALTLPQRVNFLLDEFSNIPEVPDMPSMISAARSRNIKFFLIIQGLDQLSNKYGADNANTIKGNCANWAFLTSRELPLLNEISDLCGQDAMTGEKLITVSQLQRLNKERGEVLILLGRHYPYIAHLADISEYRLDPPGEPVYPRLPSDAIRYLTIREILPNSSAVARQQEEDDFDFLPDIDLLEGLSPEHSNGRRVRHEIRKADLAVIRELLDAMVRLEPPQGVLSLTYVMEKLGVSPSLAKALMETALDAGVIWEHNELVVAPDECDNALTNYCYEMEYYWRKDAPLFLVLQDDNHRLFLEASRRLLKDRVTSVRWMRTVFCTGAERAQHILQLMEGHGVVLQGENGTWVPAISSDLFEENVISGVYDDCL